MRKLRFDVRGRRTYALLMAALFCVLCFLCFFKLTYAPMERDESRHGVSAYEMAESGDAIVTTYRHETDYFNLKPPLSIYQLCAGFALFGYNNLGLRALAGVLWIGIAVIYSAFAYKRLGRLASALTLILFACPYRMFMWHGTRFGNADMQHVFYSALSMLCLIKYEGKNKKYLYLACACFAFDFLTKGWHAGALAAEVLAYLLLYDRKSFKSIKTLLMCALCALGPVAVWAALRYSRDGTEFFVQMVKVDVLQRSTEVMDGHPGSPFFYVWRVLIDVSSLGMCALIAADAWVRRKLILKDPLFRVGVLYFALPLFLFSLATSKYMWYTFTIYPALILMSAGSFRALLDSDKPPLIKKRLLALPALLLCAALTVTAVYVCSLKPNTLYNDTQASADALSKYRGSDVYKQPVDDPDQQKPTNSDWPQREVLLLKYAGNLQPREGGSEAWLEAPDALMFCANTELSKISVPWDCVFQGEKYSIVKHSQQ